MNDSKLIDIAAKQALQGAFAPQQQPPQVQQGIPLNGVCALVQSGIISPRQAWHWIFKQVEPVEFDGIEIKEAS